MRALLLTFSWQELRHHPWRNAAAVVAVMLGVALAFSVDLINASALDEFSSAVRSVNGQPDLELRAAQGSFDETVYARVATHPQVLLASPVLELNTLVRTREGVRRPLRIVGIDALVVASIAPALMPVPHAQADRMALFAPGQVFLNPSARSLLGDGALDLQSALALRQVQVAGSVSAAGAPLGVMDLGAAQDLFGRWGELTRIDVKLKPGTDRAAFLRSLQTSAVPGLTAAEPGDAAQRVSNLSRAYRVNLTVLALVALFTGAFLVFSVLSLGVAKRQQQFALLGVLGLSGRERLYLVLAESLVLGVAGSVAGIALGTALAATALRLLGGDLGGGYFSGVAPTLQWSGTAAFAYAALGVLAALAGGWWPARAVQALPPAQALKGLGAMVQSRAPLGWSLLAMAAAGLLALTPPLFGIPVAAYVAVGLLLVGGIGALPALIDAVYGALGPRVATRLLPLLAVERARRASTGAAVAISGVVAALSLAVALTVMVASFRDSVTRWLDVVLPAELYVRTSAGTGVGDAAYFDAAFVHGVERLPGVQRVATVRTRSLLLDSSRPPVMLLARALDDPARALPLIGALVPVPAGHVGIYVSEAMVDLYGARPGTVFAPLGLALGSAAQRSPARFFVAGVWRDYVRQFGSIALDQSAYRELTGDTRVNDLALWLTPDTREADVQQRIRVLAESQPDGSAALIEFASASQLRATSLRIFDRSFAVTYWLQAVAIFIGLFGVAASFSAQVLARAKEFGLLAHLGLTRRQILGVVAGEGAAWTAIGALAGLGLGLAVSVVLVHVVNPQSFHWTMDLAVPWLRLAALCAAVVAAGTATAWLAGRAAAGRDAVLAVKEDW
jgi:putative ABC transport system permease protein